MANEQVETRRSLGTSVTPRRRALLVLVGDSIVTKSIPLIGEIVIGRGETADFLIDDQSISRSHLRMVLTPDQVSVVDLESANGTSIRGVRIPPRVAVAVSANEPIGMGDVTVVLQEVRPFTSGAAARSRPAGEITAREAEPIVIDPAMRRLYDLARRIAPGTLSVLVVGETGTGKERLAEFLHRASPRAAEPLVRINCAALSDSLVESELFGHEAGAFTGAQRERRGLLENAHRGTVFLDEIGELPHAIQAAMLRVLEEGTLLRVGGSTPRPIDVRFVAATNRDLDEEIAAGRFRQDLYYRIAGGVLEIPPLRQRPDEIEPIAHAFAVAAATRLGRAPVQLGESAVAQLRAHTWPGNVRELRNAIERAVLLVDSGNIESHHLPLSTEAARSSTTATPATLESELADLERKRILDALETCGGNQTRAAELLGMPRRTLIKRLDAYGVLRPRKR